MAAGDADLTAPTGRPVGAAAPLLGGWIGGVSAGIGTIVLGRTIATSDPAAGWVIGVLVVVGLYLCGYALATRSVLQLLPALTLPLAQSVRPPSGTPIALPQSAGELCARAAMIGLTAVLNAWVLNLLPTIGSALAGWALLIGSLAAIPAVARHRRYQGVLGWSGWLLPMSYPATAVGVLLLLASLLAWPFSAWPLSAGPLSAWPVFPRPSRFRLDRSTGVIETTGGVCAITSFVGGYSLGNLTFITHREQSGSFTAPTIPSHEVGHSLNTAALGAIVLWINAFDENRPTFRRNVAYGELLAESHAQQFPGPQRNSYFVPLWSRDRF